MPISASSTGARHGRRRSFMAQPYKHPDTGIFYIRRKVPPDLRPALTREYKRSLKTRDPAEAKSRFAEAWSESVTVFALAKAQMQGTELLSDGDVRRLASRWFREEAERMERQGTFAGWLVQGETAGDELNGIEVPQPMALREAVEEDEDFDLPALVGRQISKMLRAEGIPMPAEKSPALQKLRLAFRENVLKLSDLASQRQQGDWLTEPESAASREPLDVSSRGTTKPALRLLALFEKYAEDKKLTDGETRGGRKSIAAYRASILQFIELCGDLQLHEISRDAVGQYRSLLVRLPSRGEGVRKLSANQMIEKADAEDLPRVSAPTVLNKLLALSAVLSFGVRMGLMTENPVIKSGTVKAAKSASNRSAGSRRRKDYTEDEIRRIFTSPIFSDQGWSSSRGDFGKAWYWMPLLLYYTGARREELAQLAVKDVRYDQPTAIPFLNILAAPDEDDGGRGVKNEGSRRRIPLHADLLSRGFMEYVHGLPSDGQLFPLMKPGPDGFYGTNFGKRWGNYLRDVVGLESSASPVHGFRHTFRTLCRDVGIPEVVGDALTGHVSKQSEGGKYGEVKLRLMADELKKYPLAVPAPTNIEIEIQPL